MNNKKYIVKNKKSSVKNKSFKTIISKFSYTFIFIFIVLLIISVKVHSIDESLFEKKSLILENNIIGEFTSEYSFNSKFSYLKFYFSSYPKKEYYNIIKQDFEPQPLFLNDSVLFEWNKLKKNYFFKINSVLKNEYYDSKVKNKISYYEYKKNIPESLKEYTKSTELIDSENKKIKLLAVSLAEGSESFLDLERRIIKYVNNNVEYNLSTINIEGSFKASEVLERKEGVCDEITILFIALNRALGIPSRYVSGYSFSDLFEKKGSWLGHSWAEVYYEGEWIPFDLTYEEYLHLDPLHVAFKKTKTPGRSENNYEWKGYNVKVNLKNISYDFKILNDNSKKISFGSLKAKVLKQNIGEYSYNILEVNLKNNNEFTIMPVIKAGYTSGLEFENYNKIVILYPYEEKKVYFLFRLKDDLEYNYIYTYPIFVYAIGFNNKTVTFKAEKNSYVYSKNDFEEYFFKTKSYEEKISVNCNFKKEYYSNINNNVTCNVKNEGNKNYKVLSLCLDYTCKNFDLKINEEKNMSLTFKTKKGFEKKVLRLKENNKVLYYKKINFTSIKKEKINFSILLGEKNIILNFSSNRILEGKIKVYLNKKLYKSYIFKNKKILEKISIDETKLTKLENDVKVVLEYESLEGKKIIVKKIKLNLKKDFNNIIRIIYNNVIILF